MKKQLKNTVAILLTITFGPLTAAQMSVPVTKNCSNAQDQIALQAALHTTSKNFAQSTPLLQSKWCNIRTFKNYPNQLFTSVAFSPDETQLITTACGEGPKTWDAQTGALIKELPYNHKIGRNKSHDGKFFAKSGPNNTIEIFEWQDPCHDCQRPIKAKTIATLQGHTTPPNYTIFSSDNKQIGTKDSLGIAKLWDVQTGRCIQTFIDPSIPANKKGNGRAHAQYIKAFGFTNIPVASMTLSPKGTYVATGTPWEAAKIWNAHTGALLYTIAKYCYTAFSSDEKLFATYAGTKNAKIWDLQTGELVHTLEDDKDVISGLAFNADNSRIATISNKIIKIWELGADQEDDAIVANKKENGCCAIQ